MACMMGSLAFGFCQPILKHEARRLMLKRQIEDGHQEIEMSNNSTNETKQEGNGG
jgi:dihydroorotase